MKYNIIFTILFLIITQFSFAAGGSDKGQPQWVLNLEEVYPNAQFVTARGEGATRREAETRAAAVISQYFLSQITAEQSSRAVYTTRNDAVNVERQTIDNTVIETQMKITAMRYAQDPWHNKKAKQWETIVYINRNEAWDLYEPNAKRQSDALLNLIRAADEEKEPFNAFLRYGNALAYEGGAEYSGARLFSQVLNPGKANMLFADADKSLSAIMQKRFDVREKSRMFIECPVDFDKIVYQAAVKAVGAYGFSVEPSRANTQTRVVIQVEEGAQKLDAGQFYYPALTMTVSVQKGSLFSFKVQGERSGAMNPDLAKRRAYTALAGELEKSFAVELEKHQKSLIGK